MDTKEMRELPLAELRSESDKLEAKIWNMRFQAKGEPLENSGSFREMKRDRARFLTILREKELGGEEASAVPAVEEGGVPEETEEVEDASAAEAVDDDTDEGSEDSAEEPGEA